MFWFLKGEEREREREREREIIGTKQSSRMTGYLEKKEKREHARSSSSLDLLGPD